MSFKSHYKTNFIFNDCVFKTNKDLLFRVFFKAVEICGSSASVTCSLRLKNSFLMALLHWKCYQFADQEVGGGGDWRFLTSPRFSRLWAFNWSHRGLKLDPQNKISESLTRPAQGADWIIS